MMIRGTGLTRRIAATAGAAMVIALSAPALAADAKPVGQFGWLGVGTAYTIEEGHIYWVGEFSGTFFNDAGPGSMMHNSAVKCPAYNDLDFNKDTSEAAGYCVVSDSDGGQAFLNWACSGTATGGCEGTFQWTGGTGKYEGISGDNTFTGVTEVNHADGTSSGYAIWNR